MKRKLPYINEYLNYHKLVHIHMEQKWWIQEIQQQINFQNIAKLLDFCRFFQRKSVLV